METDPALPISISLIAQRYLLFDNKAISWLRREHNICGVLIGSIPQSPSQNLFLGLPVELMPEEAQLLISKGLAVIVNDARAHDQMLHDVNLERQQKYLIAANQEAQTVMNTREIQKEHAFRKKGLKNIVRKATEPVNIIQNEKQTINDITTSSDADILFSDPKPATSASSAPVSQKAGSTPATSYPLVLSEPRNPTLCEAIPRTYPLFAHLHSRGYFISPGLRFGCQYMAYPGDPLRYHSHFLVNGANWDDEINLMDVVGGGRLGTGVKKGYLLGGTDPSGNVKTFSIEWAGM